MSRWESKEKGKNVFILSPQFPLFLWAPASVQGARAAVVTTVAALVTWGQCHGVGGSPTVTHVSEDSVWELPSDRQESELDGFSSSLADSHLRGRMSGMRLVNAQKSVLQIPEGCKCQLTGIFPAFPQVYIQFLLDRR